MLQQLPKQAPNHPFIPIQLPRSQIRSKFKFGLHNCNYPPTEFSQPREHPIKETNILTFFLDGKLKREFLYSWRSHNILWTVSTAQKAFPRERKNTQQLIL